MLYEVITVYFQIRNVSVLLPPPRKLPCLPIPLHQEKRVGIITYLGGPVNVRFLCTAFSLVLLSACSSTPKIADIQIKANWCADHLDTRAGTCTKDLISDGDTTIALQFTYAERAHILDTARALGFFQLPHEVSVVSEMEIIGSDTLYTFQFTEPSCRCSVITSYSIHYTKLYEVSCFCFTAAVDCIRHFRIIPCLPLLIRVASRILVRRNNFV